MDAAVYDDLYAMEERHWWFRGRRAVLWALIRRAGVERARRLLDAGCGTGRNLVELRPIADEVEGADPSPRAVEYCGRRGLEGVVGAGLERLPFEDRRFDLLLATDVLEHVDDDCGALAELLRVATPDATLIVTVPAYDWLWSRHDETHHHRRRYRRRELVLRAAGSGWRVERCTYFNTLLLGPIAGVRLVARMRGSRQGGRSDYELTGARANALLEAPMRFEAALIGRGVDLPAGVSIGMVCRAGG